MEWRKHILLKILFSEFQWYRKWTGGIWENWWVDPCKSFMWLDFDELTPKGGRPSTGEPVFGTPIQEDWRKNE